MALLQMKGILKAFSGVPVLNGVNFTLETGEIHALLGENGAGKSTLMNILTGVIDCDAGTIAFDGTPMEKLTISKTEAAGISFVHQELNVINDLKVVENIFLNRELTGPLGCLRKKEMREITRKLFSDLGVAIDPDALVSGLKLIDDWARVAGGGLYKRVVVPAGTYSIGNGRLRLFERVQLGTNIPSAVHDTDHRDSLRCGIRNVENQIVVNGHDPQTTAMPGFFQIGRIPVRHLIQTENLIFQPLQLPRGCGRRE